LAGLLSGRAQAAVQTGLDVEVLRLDNGMTFLLVDRPAGASVAAGWVARVGSADDPAGQTGLAHFLEHVMFKGTRTIGTTDGRREAELERQEEETAESLRRLRGEAAGGGADGARQSQELQDRLLQIAGQRRLLQVPDEYDRIYSRAGATGINAFTTADLTAYFLSLPANRLELWFWMESDRLLDPVFRDFATERQVIAEERRQGESTPTGPFADQLEALFWQAHPYRWPRLGWPADVETLTPQDAVRHFRAWYGPGNLTAVLVGRFDRARVRELAKRYFGRLPPVAEPRRVSAREPEQRAETRLLADCNCAPQLEMRYHAVPFLHADAAALEVLAGLLDGRAGRLYQGLVLGPRLASAGSAALSPLARAGWFAVRLQAAEAVPLERLEQCWAEVLRPLQQEPVADRELARVKSSLMAEGFRQLEDPFALMVRLLTDAGQGDWHALEEQPQRLAAVTAEDVLRVARTYFRPENRTVALFRRLPPAAGAARP